MAYWGGFAFHCFWSIAALVVLWEWDTLVCEHDRNPVLTIGAVALIGSSLLLAFDWVGTAVVLIGLGFLAWRRSPPASGADGAPQDWSMRQRS